MRARSPGSSSSIRRRTHDLSPPSSRSCGMGRIWPAVSAGRLRSLWADRGRYERLRGSQRWTASVCQRGCRLRRRSCGV
jgi:hypothetical protein